MIKFTKMIILLILIIILIVVIAIAIHLSGFGAQETSYLIGAPKTPITQQISFCWDSF